MLKRRICSQIRDRQTLADWNTTTPDTAKAQLDLISRDGSPPLVTYLCDKTGRLDTLTHENGIMRISLRKAKLFEPKKSQAFCKDPTCVGGWGWYGGRHE